MKKVLQIALLLLVLAGLIYAAYVVPSQMLDEIKRQTATHPVTVTTDNPTVTTEIHTVTDAPEPTKTTAHVTANEALHVRENPTEHSNALYWLDAGSEVTLSGACVDGWAELESGGWVNAEYLDKEVCNE